MVILKLLLSDLNYLFVSQVSNGNGYSCWPWRSRTFGQRRPSFNPSQGARALIFSFYHQKEMGGEQTLAFVCILTAPVSLWLNLLFECVQYVAGSMTGWYDRTPGGHIPPVALHYARVSEGGEYLLQSGPLFVRKTFVASKLVCAPLAETRTCLYLWCLGFRRRLILKVLRSSKFKRTAPAPLVILISSAGGSTKNKKKRRGGLQLASAVISATSWLAFSLNLASR